jgi:hypothetical protein
MASHEVESATAKIHPISPDDNYQDAPERETGAARERRARSRSSEQL